MADPAEKMMMLWQRRQDQRQARRLGMVLEHCLVNGTKESLGVGLDRLLFPAVAVVHGHTPPTDATIGTGRIPTAGYFCRSDASNCFTRLRNRIGSC